MLAMRRDQPPKNRLIRPRQVLVGNDGLHGNIYALVLEKEQVSSFFQPQLFFKCEEKASEIADSLTILEVHGNTVPISSSLDLVLRRDVGSQC